MKILQQSISFGISIDDLSVFRIRIPRNKTHSEEALDYICAGIEHFEIPLSGLGTPIDMQREEDSSQMLARNLGLGVLKAKGSIKANKTDINHDELLSMPAVESAYALVQQGFQYTPLRRFTKRGIVHSDGTYRQRIDNLSQETKDQFMHSLEMLKTSVFYNKKPNAELPMASVPRLMNLLSEVEESKYGRIHTWELPSGDLRRIKHRSTSDGREGWWYITRSLTTGDEVKYACSCPATTNCKHIDYAKEILTTGRLSIQDP